MCFDVTNEMFLTLKEFLKNMPMSTTVSASLTKHGKMSCPGPCTQPGQPQRVTAHDFKGLDAQEAEEIMSIGKSMSLDIDGADTEELVEDHEEELKMGLAGLQSEQQKLLIEERCNEEEEGSNNAIEHTTEKWNKCLDFFEKHHRNVTTINRI